MTAIETTGLTKYYGAQTVVSDVSLQVPKACVYGFVGPNGAGKTTVMRLLLGLLRADAGTVRLFGHDLQKNRRAALGNVGAVIESPALYGHLSGWSNLRLTCTLLGLPDAEADRVLELVELTKASGQKVGTYSLGMKQRLAIARTLLGAPRLLLLDEPTNGLDPDGIISMRAFIRDLPDRINGTVFVSSHLLSEVQQIADYVGLMQTGRLTIQDKVASLIGNSSNYLMEVDDPGRGTEILIASGFVAENRSGAILLICANDRDVREQTARANRLLVQAGHAVSGLSSQPTSLEDIYRVALNQAPIEQRAKI